MANRNEPKGFTPAGMLDGSRIPVMQFPLLSTHIRIGVGDCVEALAGGNIDGDDDPGTGETQGLGVVVALYDSNKNPIGSPNSSIATNYIVASTGGYADVALATPGAKFRVQCDGSMLETARFAHADSAYTACNIVTGRSATELTSTTSTTGNWLILDKVDEPSNDWGTNVEVIVTPAECVFMGSSTGV